MHRTSATPTSAADYAAYVVCLIIAQTNNSIEDTY